MNTLIIYADKLYFLIYDLIKTRDQITYITNLKKLNIETYTKAVNYYDNHMTSIDTNAQSIFHNQLLNCKNIKKLILLMKDMKFKLAHKVSLFMYLKAELYNNIIDFIKYGKHKLPNDMLDIKKIITNHIQYIKAFKKDVTSADNELNENINKMKVSNTDYHKFEIIERLQQLVKYFKIKTFVICDIDLITYDDAIDMTYKELIKYYNKVIKKLSKKLKKIKYYCDAYLELDIAEHYSVLFNDDDIDVNKFKIIIESK